MKHLKGKLNSNKIMYIYKMHLYTFIPSILNMLTDFSEWSEAQVNKNALLVTEKAAVENDLRQTRVKQGFEDSNFEVT